VQRFGGAKALTKPEIVDPVAKCSLIVEETGKMDFERIGKMLENNALGIRNLEAVHQQALECREVEPAKTSPRAVKLEFGQGKLYDLEPGRQPEKTLKIDLDLYQMEDV
jgi:superfamily I DNA/RNA helicase